MSDVFSAKKRSQIMRSIHGTNTRPEQLVALWLRGKSIRFRRHVSWLPGRPDFVLDQYRVALFVHGCFWHAHRACRKGRIRPRTRADFWEHKIKGNVRRDVRSARRLRSMGYSVLTIWECTLKKGSVSGRVEVLLRQAMDRRRQAIRN